VKTAPWMRTPEFHKPLGIPGVPEVLLWKSSPQVQRTVSPGRIVTDEGEKTNAPLGATVTLTVIAVAGLVHRVCAGTLSLAVASSSHGEQEFSPQGGRWYSLRGESCESTEVRRVFS
jgi:hypothetical protein